MPEELFSAYKYDYKPHGYLPGRWKPGMSAEEEEAVATALHLRHQRGETMAAIARSEHVGRNRLAALFMRYGFPTKTEGPRKPDSPWAKYVARRRARAYAAQVIAADAQAEHEPAPSYDYYEPPDDDVDEDEDDSGFLPVL